MSRIDTNIYSINKARKSADNNISQIEKFVNDFFDEIRQLESRLESSESQIKSNIFKARGICQDINKLIEKCKEELSKAQTNLKQCRPPITITVKYIDSDGIERYRSETSDPDASKRNETLEIIKMNTEKIAKLEEAREPYIEYLETQEEALKSMEEATESIKDFSSTSSEELRSLTDNYYEIESICSGALAVLEEFNSVNMVGYSDVSPLTHLRYEKGKVVSSYNGVTNSQRTANYETKESKPTIILDINLNTKDELNIYLVDICKKYKVYYLKFLRTLDNFKFTKDLEMIDKVLLNYAILPTKTVFGTRKIDSKGYYIYER